MSATAINQQEPNPYGDIRTDPAAFTRLYDAHHVRCRRHLESRYRHRQSDWGISASDVTELVEDAVQFAFCLARRRFERYDPQLGALTTWVNTIARNQFVDQLRDLVAYRRRHPELSAEAEAETQTANGLDAWATRYAVAQTIARLAPAQGRVVMLHCDQGRKVREVAEMTGTSEQATKALRLT